MTNTHLPLNLKGPLLSLEEHILKALPDIEHWFRTKWMEHTVPFYASVDLRNSGFKLAPVDTNLFPGGFNNLHHSFLPLSVQAAMSAIDRICPDATNLLLIPENHTRNQFYLKNVYALASILRQAGMNVRIGTLLPEITEPTPFILPEGQTLLLEPCIRTGNRIGLKDFDPCVVLLNNDLSAGVPDILKNLEQKLLPPLFAGWFNRRKSVHFSAYERITTEFGKLIQIDPWIINPYFSYCGEIDFHERQGEDCLATHVEEILNDIRQKYKEYQIDQEPFVIVKANQGTYGMGIMTVKDPSEVVGLNRKQRNKMSVIKEGQEVSEVLVQEGVYTFETIDDGVAEPVIYMMDRSVIGGFYRVHTGRGINENLNAPGMHFVPVPFDTACITPDSAAQPDALPNRFYTYGVIARLALLASALELELLAEQTVLS